jgi:hypothetical protein
MDGQPDVATALHRLAANRVWIRHGALLSAASAVLAAAVQPLLPSLVAPLLFAAIVEATIVYFVASGSQRLTADLAVERAYYAIPEVRRYGERLKAPRARERLADWLVELIDEGANPETLYLGDRVAEHRRDLLAVAADLRSPYLDAHASTLATCLALLTRGSDSPLYNRRIPPDALRAVLLRIRLGFHERSPTGSE